MAIVDKPKVFTDFHHASLLNSLIMLFEGRLGGEVYRPIGEDWATNNYWKVYDHPATQAQFLTKDQGFKPVDGTFPLNKIKKVEKDVYYCQDIDSGKFNKAIDLNTFKSLDIDIVIASLPQHIELYNDLIKKYKSNAKLIYQIGNAWNVEAGSPVKNVMASAIVDNIPKGINFISYHQEFDLDIFHYAEPYQSSNIYSFINIFQSFPDYPLFLELEKMMTGWSFKSFGGQCRDGAMHGTKALADKMREARFILHLKAGGDGYGHVIHNAFAVGRPPIVKKSYYNGKLAESLMIDGVTCIDIDNLSLGEIVNKINYYNETSRYNSLCENAYKRFKEIVDFDKEEVAIKQFLNNLK